MAPVTLHDPDTGFEPDEDEDLDDYEPSEAELTSWHDSEVLSARERYERDWADHLRLHS